MRVGGRTGLAELPALWADIDVAKNGLDEAGVQRALASLPSPPSALIHSGGGLHVYWFLREAISLDLGASATNGSIGGSKADPTDEGIVDVLRRLADIVAGDTAVCDLARIMRLPGTHNSKPAVIERNGGHAARCRVIEMSSGCRYEFADLKDWVSWQRQVVQQRGAAQSSKKRYLQQRGGPNGWRAD
jgi:hypothetical protein